MIKTHKTRKRRSDRKHLIYVLTNKITRDEYIGMAVCVDRSGKETLNARWCRHVGRSKTDKKWNLYMSIRQYGPENFDRRILTFVRGKAEAHALETELKKTGKYSLNTV